MPDHDSVWARFTVPIAALGFAPPPAALRLRLLRAKNGSCSLYVSPVVPMAPGDIFDWLLGLGVRRLELGRQGIVRADLAAAPPRLDALLPEGAASLVLLQPDADAIVSIVGSRAAAQEFAKRLRDAGLLLEMSRIERAPRASHLMTAPQDAALRLAVAEGYYRIPRTANLHDLANQMGISAASLSERLRRAEERVIMGYVEEGQVPASTTRSADDPGDLDEDDA